MGGRTNGVGDAVSFTRVLERYTDQVVAGCRRIDYATSELAPELLENIVSAYRAAGAQHRSTKLCGTQWGFKNPRQIFLLPVLNLAFPGVRFVHVVRDGRDMLLSHNKNQALKHFQALFGDPFDQSLTQIAQFWARTNLEVLACGMARLGSRYITVRIEDLCGPNRSEHIAKLAHSLGLDGDKAQLQADTFRLPSSHGRGRAVVDQLESPVREEFCSALARFGYV